MSIFARFLLRRGGGKFEFNGFSGEGIGDGAAVFEAFGGSFGDDLDEVDLDEFVVV
jgi:hypothetical protein